MALDSALPRLNLGKTLTVIKICSDIGVSVQRVLLDSRELDSLMIAEAAKSHGSRRHDTYDHMIDDRTSVR